MAGVRDFALQLQHLITPPILIVSRQLNMLSNLLDPDFKTPSRSPSLITTPSTRSRSKLWIEFDTPTRVRVKTKTEDGLTRAKIRQQTGVPERTQRRICNESQSDRRPGHLRPGPREQIDRKLLHRIIDYITSGYAQRTTSWEDLRQQFTPWLKQARTVKKHLNMAGYFKCKACQKSYLRETSVELRNTFCSMRFLLANPLEHWRSVRFTDEVHFCKDSRSAEWVIRSRDERFCLDCMQFRKNNHASELHAWAMVGYNFKSDIIFFDINELIQEDPSWQLEVAEQQGEPQPAPVLETIEEEQRLLNDSNCNHKCKNKAACKHACCKGYRAKKRGRNLTQKQYLEWILKGHIEPIWRQHQAQGRQFILCEDNDGLHGTRTLDNPVRRYKDLLEGFMWYANPPQSPDFNIIEHCWRIIKQRIKQRKPTTVEELRQYIKEEWDAIPQETINEYVESIPQRMKEGMKRGGLQTPW